MDIYLAFQYNKYFNTLYPSYSILFFGSFILYLMGRRQWLAVKDIAEQWIILIPAVKR